MFFVFFITNLHAYNFLQQFYSFWYDKGGFLRQISSFGISSTKTEELFITAVQLKMRVFGAILVSTLVTTLQCAVGIQLKCNVIHG